MQKNISNKFLIGNVYLRNILFVLALWVVNSVAANNLYQVEIPENHKLEGTHSVALDNQSATFHLIILKEKNKGYKLIPIYVGSNSEAKELKTIDFENLPTFMSHHSNGSTITLVGYDDRKDQISILDIDTVSGIHSITTEIDKEFYYNIFRLEDKSVLVRNNKKRTKLEILEIIDSKQRTSSQIDIGADIKKEFKKFTKLYPDAINRNEYVKNGSIQERKSYISEHTIIFTLDDKYGLTKTMAFNWDNNTIKSQSFTTTQLRKIKDYTSYIHNDMLFSIASNRGDLVLNAFDFETGDQKKSMSLKEEISKNSGDYSSTIEFLKTASRGKIKPTVTLNRSKNNKIVVRLDNVQKETYHYNYNWWLHHWTFQNHMWHMQQQQMMQMNTRMQQLQNNSRALNRFTPNGEFYDRYYDVFGAFKEETAPIEFVLDENFDLMPIESSTDTYFSKVDKIATLEPFEDDKDLKELTAGFTQTEMRYIYMDRKSKVIYLKNQEL